MLCIKCNERIPLISDLDFHLGTISLYCQCDNENEIYNIREYIIQLNQLKETNKDFNIKNQVCFIHKDNEIELFCIDCAKELCRECDLQKHQKENHQLYKLENFYEMINLNLNYFKNIKDLKYFETFNIEYISDIINFVELAFKSFNSQKDSLKKNFTALKNICYMELRLSEYDTKNLSANTNGVPTPEKNGKLNKKNKYQFGKKINSIKKYLNIKKLCLKGDNISPSFLNVLLIPDSYHCVLISSDCKLIEYVFSIDSKLYSSMYKLSLLNEKIFSLLYNSGSFDLFFIDKERNQNKIKLIRKKYINHENSTNIIKQIQLSKEDNNIIVLNKNKIQFYKYNENEDILLIKEIDRNDITLMLSLNFHDSVLTLFQNQEIIIRDKKENHNYIINIKERQINIILELKSFNYLVITHFDSDIDIFDLNLMIMKNKLKGHKKIVNDLKELIPLQNSNYNPKLISCSDDKTIRIWDLIKFFCEYIISLENYNFIFSINILPSMEIMALDNENRIYIID